DTSFDLITTMPGAFVDAAVPSGFAPFGITPLGDKVFVTYAMQDDEKMDDVRGAGLGYLAEFDTSGALLATMHVDDFNAPWGLALAPGAFALGSTNALLVANFGDGHITVIDLATLSDVGQLAGADGNPLAIDGLWGVLVGSSGAASPNASVYF